MSGSHYFGQGGSEAEGREEGMEAGREKRKKDKGSRERVRNRKEAILII